MLTRRAFVRDGALALVSLGFAPSFLARTARAAASRNRILVAIFQRGAVDGLNVVVPFGEAAYYRARPGIAIAPPGRDGGAIDLDGFFGLHPRLAALKPIFDARHLAIVHAVGSPDNTRSHFDAQDYMESATPGVKSTTDGWLNRCLRAAPGGDAATPFRAVALAPQLPRALQGSAPALALNQLAQFGVRPGKSGANMEQAFADEYQAAADQVLNATGREAFDAVRQLRAANPQKYQPANGADYPRAAFGDAMRQIAQLVKADVGLQVAFADVGGWDTHVNQGGATGQLANRLDEFGRGLAAFFVDLDDRMADVVLLTMSEFGRTTSQNGTGGTDHGHANAMLVMGGGVGGGHVYGPWPGLAREQLYEGRDLAVTTDFRDVFGEIVVKHLGVADASPIFPGYTVSPARFRGFLNGRHGSGL
jgi:uncharacterized protein (DUF1501 family)